MKKKLSKKQIGKASGGIEFGSAQGPQDPKPVEDAIKKDDGSGGLKPKSGLMRQ